MPKFVIERQYLVPMFQHIVVEAENLEEACKKGISDDIDWDTQEMDCDSARATTITEAKIVPEGYEADQAHSLIIASRDPKVLPLDMLSLATFLYEFGGYRRPGNRGVSNATARSGSLPARNELEVFRGHLLEKRLVLALWKRPQDRRGLLAGVPVLAAPDPDGPRKGGTEPGEEFLGRGDGR